LYSILAVSHPSMHFTLQHQSRHGIWISIFFFTLDPRYKIRSGLNWVSIGSHSLLLRASAPPRDSPSQPAVIIEAGLGRFSSEWVAAQRLISQFARVYSYDRAGYANSKAERPSPLPPSAQPLTATKRCEELTKLLQVAGVTPPWVLVGQSYGGVLVRESLSTHGKEKVVGMVIVDSAVERTKLPDN